LATSGFMSVRGYSEFGCRDERETYFPPEFADIVEPADLKIFERQRYKRTVCPWFTGTKVDNKTLYVSVERNETGVEREIYFSISSGNIFNYFTVIQSAD